ncbi:hypothetical protein [Sulfitobacter pontiacus]|uniref:hypothetical protein n=1 Tax=Sulfitobacter pontiacus TaxID=60137 RepID=UPI0030EF8E30
MTHLETLALAAAILISYSFISVRFSRAVQPLRIRVVEDINRLCQDNSIPDDVKDDLRILADNMFNKVNGWLIVTLFPFVLVKRAFRKNQDGRKSQLSGRTRSKVTQVFGVGLLCMIATSPLCMVIFAIEFIFSLVIAAPWGWIRSLSRAVTSVDQHISTITLFSKP